MARSHGAMPNTGRPAQRRPAETDPRNARPQTPAPRYPQAPQAPAYPQQATYPDPQPQNPGYDPQTAYHYPQQQAPQPQPQQYPQGLPARPTARPNGLDPVTQPGAADYNNGYPSTQPPFGQSQQAHPQQRSFAPTSAPAHQPAAPAFPPSTEPRTAPPSYNQWSAPAPQSEPRGYDLGTYLPNGAQPDLAALRGGLGNSLANGAFAPDPLQQQPEWVHAAQVPYGDAGLPEHQAYGANRLGYEQPHHGGALEASGHEEGDYEYDEPRRGSWVLRIAGAVVVAVGLGYGIAQGYKMILGGSAEPGTPIVKGDSAPAKTVPTDPGGKQFAHADSKVMGRLGDGAPASDETGSATSTDTDSSGTRKVQTVVVGRDGAIQPPAAPAAAAADPAQPAGDSGSVSVPGLTVIDGFGGRYPSNNRSAPPAAASSVTTATVSPQAPATPPASKAAKHAKAKAPAPPPAPAAETDAATFDESTAPAAKAPAAPKKQVAAADPGAAAVSSGNAANGYVVVLASIPATSTGPLDALKRFADMQQKYGAVLANKTPEVREANLGDKGMFNRLLVGPPGSRSQATQLCTQLKAAGYKDCWVTAY